MAHVRNNFVAKCIKQASEAEGWGGGGGGVHCPNSKAELAYNMPL